MRVESELFRIAQEALTNVRKHAHATHAEICLKRRGGRVTLSVLDDGRGFSPSRRRSDGHGLVGMRERAKLLGGHLRVSSGPGRGTRIVASVPLGAQP
jgi:signal transduction histidine kinase